MTDAEESMVACDFHGSMKGGGHPQETCGDCIQATEHSLTGAKDAPKPARGKRKIIA